MPARQDNRYNQKHLNSYLIPEYNQYQALKKDHEDAGDLSMGHPYMFRQIGIREDSHDHRQ